MKITKHNNTYDIYGDELTILDALDAACYSIEFSKNRGFFLVGRPNIRETSEKIYGNHMKMVEKVLNSFSAFERNLGVILSGDKGIGKTIFTKILMFSAQEQGLPVLIVDKYIPGLASFISSIEQEVVVVFDEYDKTFGGITPSDGCPDPQTELLSLFDGIDQGKKMFVITCNEIGKLSSFLLNRPGRFHYHFRFAYPSPEEIREYLSDHLSSENCGAIDQIVAFSKKVNLNYDCLRAIAFELEQGEQFSDAIKYLNIVNTDRTYYSVKAVWSNGETAVRNRTNIEMFSGDWASLCLNDKTGDNVVDLLFDPKKIRDTADKDTLLVLGEDVEIQWISEDFKPQIESASLDKIIICKQDSSVIHYLV